MIINEKDGKLEIKLEGRIDTNNAPDVEQEIMSALDANDGKEPIFDAENLEYISSAGIRILLRAGRQCKAEGKAYAVCGAAGFVKEVLEDANLDVLVEMYPSEESLP